MLSYSKNATRIEPIHIIGAGGHAKVVLAALKTLGYARLTVWDEHATETGKLLDYAVLALTESQLDQITGAVHIAIGNNTVRSRLRRSFESLNKKLFTIIHPSAQIAPWANIQAGSFVAAGACVGPSAQISAGVIVNHHAVIDHDCVIGPDTHVAPSATLGGNVRVGSRVMIGAGATILPGMMIEDDVVIGAGAVVTRNITSKKIVYGVPAKERGENHG